MSLLVAQFGPRHVAHYPLREVAGSEAPGCGLEVHDARLDGVSITGIHPLRQIFERVVELMERDPELARVRKTDVSRLAEDRMPLVEALRTREQFFSPQHRARLPRG